MGSVTGEFELHRSVDDGQSKFHSFGKPQKEIEELEFDRILDLRIVFIFLLGCQKSGYI